MAHTSELQVPPKKPVDVACMSEPVQRVLTRGQTMDWGSLRCPRTSAFDRHFGDLGKLPRTRRNEALGETAPQDLPGPFIPQWIWPAGAAPIG